MLARRGSSPSGAGARLTCGGDILVVGDAGKVVHGPLVRLGFRVFPALSFASARTMLSAREFAGLVVVEPPAGFVPALREEAARPGRALFIIAAPAHDDEAPRLLAEGADLVLAAPLASEDIAWRVEAFLATQQPNGSFELEDVFARERIDELRDLFAESLFELDRTLARDDLAPEAIEGIAHRIKGSAANLRMGELAASADDALAAARTVVASHGSRDRAVAALRRRIKSMLRDRQSPLAPASPQVRSATEREEAHVDDRTRG